jgi:transcriptional regulator with XRE-family HTH domain
MRKLETVEDLLEALKEANGWSSDYRLAKELGVPQQTVSNWRIGSRIPGETHALVMAKALKVSPALVLTIAAAAKAAQAGDKESEWAWSTVAKHIARVGLPSLAALAVITGTFAPPAQAEAPSLHIMTNYKYP